MASRDRKTRDKTDGHRPAVSKPAVANSLDLADLQRLTEELQIHQVELEMQNKALREAQMEVEASRDRFAALYDFAPVGYVTLDERGVIAEANLTLATMLATDRTLLLDQPFVTYITSEQRPEIRRLLKKCAENPGNGSSDAILQRRDGKRITAHLIVDCPTPEASPSHIRLAVIDITEKAEAQRKLDESQSILHDALTAAHMIAWSWDLTSNKVTQSAKLGDILGSQTPDTYTVHGNMLHDIHPDDAGRYRETVLNAITQGGNYVVQYRIIPPWKDSLSWIEEHGFVVMRADHQPCSVRGIIFDVTAKKLAEEGMKTNFERLESLIANSSDPLALLDAAGNIECISKTGALMLGYEPAELLGQGAGTLVHPDDIRLAMPQREAIRTTGEPMNAMLRVRQKSGELCWVDAEVSVILPNSSSRGYLVKFSRVMIDTGGARKSPERGATDASGID